MIELNLSFDSNQNACLTLWDISTDLSNVACSAQPDYGGSEFIALPSQTDNNGYFTAP